MRHKSGRQRRGSPKNTQGFFSFPSVSGIARRRPALSACRSAAVEALTHSTQLDSARLFCLSGQCGKSTQGRGGFPGCGCNNAARCADGGGAGMRAHAAAGWGIRDEGSAPPFFFFCFLRTQEHTASFHESAQARVYHLELAHHISQQADSVQRRWWRDFHRRAKGQTKDSSQWIEILHTVLYFASIHPVLLSGD